jgi:3-oxoacyl-[acyl-carrier protein] reductase
MQEKNYLIAGGTSGIGKSITEALLAQGHHVWTMSRRETTVAGAHHIIWDAAANAQPLGWPEVLHGLVYAPGSINLRSFRALKPEDFLNDFQVNLLGAVRLLQAAQPALRAANQASVVLFSTVAVAQGMPFHASIAASKGAVEGLGRSLAAEWAPNINVNIIAPGLVNTPLAAKLLDSDIKKENSAKRHPLGRVGSPQEIAALAMFLLSDHASWISGQVIGVDGGLSTLRTS